MNDSCATSLNQHGGGGPRHSAGLVHIAVLGASGYTGAELVRLLAFHPKVQIEYLVAESQAGKKVAEVFPHLSHAKLPDLVHHTQVNWAKVDVAFGCLPHGASQEILCGLPEHVKVIDLSADFRLKNVDEYATWYGHPHQAVEIQKHAVYGLTEHAREKVKTARFVANPGCYPTASQLPLIPLLNAGLIEAQGIIIDAKSGVTGAGRAAKQQFLYTEIDGGISAYGIGHHRHTPEIEQGLSEACGKPVQVSFTPHLVPMKRGILATIYVTLKGNSTVDALKQTLHQAYDHEAFVEVVVDGQSVSTHHVFGTNRAMISVHADRVKGRAILVCAIDNLVKGASGQAVQNMNVMLGFEETLGLPKVAVFP